MTVGQDSEEIGILLYPGAQMAAVHGLTDLVAIANRFALTPRGGGLQVTHWSPDRSGAPACTYRSDPRAAGRPSVIVVPPTLSGLPEAATCARIAQWLLDRHDRGVRLVSVCSGIFLLARTGLLDGRIVSTHRSCAEALRASFPEVAIDLHARMIEHGGILTAGGFMAWVDVGLVLVERVLGVRARAETARFIRSDSLAAGQPSGTGFVPPQDHSDMAVRRAQELIHLRDGQGLSLSAMAEAARLERRTLLRRFAGATGMTPTGYCRAVRIARARELLEAGHLPLKEIATTLGYGDAAAFARAYRRATGMAPGAYRRTHQRPPCAPPAEPAEEERRLS